MARRRRFSLGQLALALLAVGLGGACRGPRSSPTPAASTIAQPTASALDVSSASASASASALPPALASATASRKLAPLRAASAQVSLAVPGFRDAVVSLPLGASTPRVVVLALHGNFDRPEWQCEVWRRITQGEVFVLCPRGIPRSDVPKELDRWEWSSVAKTKAELVAALAALDARYPDHVKRGARVFAGFSLGAILGARLLQDPELNLAAGVLIEGGYQGWSIAKAKSLRPRLRRLLFACGQSECRNAYRYQLGPVFERAGVPTSLVADVKAGHTYDDPLAALVQGEWPALLAALEIE